MKHTLKKIEMDELVGEDKLNDHNNIELLMNAKQFMKTFKLMILIMSFSYFIGIFWMIYCEVEEHINIFSSPDQEYFIFAHEIHS